VKKSTGQNLNLSALAAWFCSSQTPTATLYRHYITAL